MKTQTPMVRRIIFMVRAVAVIGIVAIIAALLFANFAPFTCCGHPRTMEAKTQCDILRSAIMLYNQRNSGKMPGSLQELAAGGYMDGDLGNDPWGNPYNLVIPGPDSHPFDVTSNGPPGKNLVISCWTIPAID